MAKYKATIGVVSLGCDKNRVDTEIMLGQLVAHGYEITNDPAKSDLIIVNTCAFLESARKESIETIIEMAGYKQSGKCKGIIVTGCLGQKFGDEVFAELTEADCVLGIGQYDKIAEIADQVLAGKRCKFVDAPVTVSEGERVLTTTHFAYVKIADGCDNFCSYCLIPYIRGRYRSRSMESIISEAKKLASSGVSEIILVAQDVTKYGIDLYGQYKLSQLINSLSEISGIEWIRLLYCYPELLTDSLIETIKNNGKVVKYVDVPLQHVDDAMLKSMNRKSDSRSINALFEKLQNAGIAVRSTFICGFPGENERTVAVVEEFLKKYRLRNVGFFEYSREDGTPAARLPNQLGKRSKKKIVKYLYAVQQQIAFDQNASEVGKTLKCVVDELLEENENGFVYVGRTEYMSPDIDGVTFINTKEKLTPGQFCQVKITDWDKYDLIGEVI